ncbi:MAG: mannose-1-phosphate guanylyltransferase [Proteobacteria bacterium]|nr:mannose-1-phosphate guanylyltransferase [Pseudomonadota bacterium]
MRWAVIMAGGSGTRFWPLSSPARPKQFLKLLGDTTPAEACVKRLAHSIDPHRILIVASESHRAALHEALPDFPPAQILWEPVGRNTAACIAWATEVIRAQDPQALIGVFPSDHAIADTNAFTQCLAHAYDNAAKRIILFGIVPSRPETGYGYIKVGQTLGENLFRVEAFLEKPPLLLAEQYLLDGHYLWNSGMFIFDAQTMHDEIRLHLPDLARGIEAIIASPDDLAHHFHRLPSISIDYGVMERTAQAAVIRAEFPWDDLGTWDAIRRYHAQDENCNASHGQTLTIDCHNTFCYNTGERPIATLGLHDIIVVNTPEAIMVMDAKHAQDVRKIVDALSKNHSPPTQS